jgi:hypothetical protein
MIAVRLIKTGTLGAVVAVAIAMTGVAPARAAETAVPWWGVTSGSRPTDLQSGVAKDEVMELTVSATAGEFVLVEIAQFKIKLFKWDVPAATLREGVEELYPGHKVEVTGGPGDEGGTKPYVITFPGQSVEAPVASGGFAAFLGGENLSGGREEASVTEISKGKPDGQIVVTAENRGDAGANGAIAPVTVADHLPPGLEAVAIEAFSGGSSNGPLNRGPVSCSITSLTCTYEGTYENESEGTVPKILRPYEQIEMRIAVVLRPGSSSGETNTATAAGGGAAKAVTASHPIEIDGSEKFGIEDYKLIPENFGGSIDTQAGSHPYQLTTVLTLNSEPPGPRGEVRSAQLPKDLVSELPPGLFGNPTPFAQCTDKQFNKQANIESGREVIANDCAPQTAVGVAVVTTYLPGTGLIAVTDPIFNMVPLPGEPARFGFKVTGIVPVILDTSVRTGKDYGVTVTSNNIIQISWLLGVKLTFWGVPGDRRHDSQRGWECLEKFGTCTPSTAGAPPPFLGLPTSCAAPFETTVKGDSWGTPGTPVQQAQPVTYRLPEALDGCNHLPFDPSITVAPDIPNGSSSTGLTVGVHVSQTATLNPEGLAESTLKDTTVALPQGVALNPAGANGLEACSEAQIGFTGVEPGSGQNLFTSDLAQPFCPDASKIGTVKIKTPLLPNALEGEVYLAAQDANPFDTLVAMYIVAQDPVSGVLVKLPGRVKLDEHSGQVVGVFENTPELPFEELEMHFFGGERAPLGTPALCGTYTTQAAFTPWSGNETAHTISTFHITSGPQGKPCSDPLPFAPSLTAGTTSIQAGGFSPFTMTMSREDGNQDLQSVSLRMPPGLLGTLSSVKLCGEAEANAGTCGPESLIGETIVSVGLGGDPYSVKGGRVYITGPYRGAPFGLSIVNPAKAGPFDLGQVIVRAKIEVDQTSSVLTITTDSSGPYAIPHILDGIPLQIKHVNVTINRPNFTFNPTNCSPLAITGSLGSSEGASSALSVPFQATNCAVLAFKPKLTASTSGKTSRAKGASLSVKLTYPAGPYDANIAKVKVDLPKQLPSRLTTLQKACPAAAFEANPANCPTGSIVGQARATTPVLPVPLTGPAYFVSHGGEEFPSLIIVLQGYGVTVHLVGTTFISKAGITSSTFKTIPDVPVGTFEMTLPNGPGSALAANGNLCKSKLAMPTSFIGQNGAVIHTSTPIAVTGCHKAKKANKHRARRGKKSRRK